MKMTMMYGCLNRDMVYISLGATPSWGGSFGYENARLTGKELQRLCRNDYWGVKVSLGYATQVLRMFREDVLTEFFTQYPDAAFIADWRLLANAVYRYTTHNGVGWKPNRAGVQNCMQKMQLLQSASQGRAIYYPQTGYLVFRQNDVTVRRCFVRPYTRGKLACQPYGDTVLRIQGGGIAYAANVAAAN